MHTILENAIPYHWRLLTAMNFALRKRGIRIIAIHKNIEHQRMGVLGEYSVFIDLKPTQVSERQLNQFLDKLKDVPAYTVLYQSEMPKDEDDSASDAWFIMECDLQTLMDIDRTDDFIHTCREVEKSKRKKR